MFENMVHNNPNFTPGQKLYYLHTTLIEEAEEILRDTPTSDEAYLGAWAEVKGNY